MKYLLLLYVAEDEIGKHPESVEDHVTVAADATVRGAYLACEGLEAPSVATTVRVRDGETIISDGPFAETKEVLGGFYLLECADLDEAIAYAQRIPPVAWGSVEIRPVHPIQGWDERVRAAAKLRTPAS
jgi:hypothetical protein